MTTTPARAAARHGAAGLVPVGLGSFALGIDAYVTAGLLTGIADDFHAGIAATGQLVTAFTLSYAVAAPALAAVVPIRRGRMLLAAALAVFTVSNVLSALAPGMAAMVVWRVVSGVAAGVYTPAAAMTAARMSDDRGRGRGLSVVMGGMSLGAVAGVPAGLVLADHLGWRATLGMVSAVSALACLLVATRLPDVRVPPPPSVRERVRTLADRDVLPIVAVTLLQTVSSLGLYTFLVPVLRAVAGVRAVAPYVCLWGLGGVVGSVLVGVVLDRTSRPLLVAPVLLALQACALLALASPAMALGMLVWGAVGWAFQLPQQHRLLAILGHRASVAIAVNSSAAYLGGAVGAALAGAGLGAGAGASALAPAAAAIAMLGAGLHVLRQRAWWTGHRAGSRSPHRAV